MVSYHFLERVLECVRLLLRGWGILEIPGLLLVVEKSLDCLYYLNFLYLGL